MLKYEKEAKDLKEKVSLFKKTNRDLIQSLEEIKNERVDNLKEIYMLKKQIEDLEKQNLEIKNMSNQKDELALWKKKCNELEESHMKQINIMKLRFETHFQIETVF